MSVPKRIVALIDAKNEEILRLEAEKAEMLAVLEELRESASYWSEYDVPLGVVERIEAAIMKARVGECD